MQGTLQDLRYAIRQLRKAPGFSLTIILTIALTISLTAAIFSVLYAVLIRPLPYRQPERIVAVQPRSAQGNAQLVSYPDYLDWRQMNGGFQTLAAYKSVGSVNFENSEGPAPLPLVSATDNFFDVFGVPPLLGRAFAAGEDQPGRNDVVVLSHEVWRHRFGSRASVIGEAVKLDGRPYSVIGVMPAAFRFPLNEADTLYIPIHPTRNQQARRNYWLTTIGRLKDGLTPQLAEADMMRVLNNQAQTSPAAKGGRINLTDMPAFVVGDTRNHMRLLFYAVLALLAIGCVNIAGLLLIRGVKRDRELALRVALGAGKWRIIKQMLIEALLFGVIGAGVGILLAYGLLHLTRALLATALARGGEVILNGQALAASIIAALLITFLASLVPSLRVPLTTPNWRLRAGGGPVGASKGQRRLRAAFVVTQFALGLVLLVTSGLLFVGLAKLRNADLGFDPDHILTAEVNLSPGHYAARNAVTEFYYPLLDKVRGIPGVKAAGLIQMAPIQNSGWNTEIRINGIPPLSPNSEQLAEYRIVSPGYFEVFQNQLVRGRLPGAGLDTPTSQPVVVVNEAFVKKFIPEGQDPIGKQLDDDMKATIIGVVRNVRQNIYQAPFAEVDYAMSQIPAEETLRVVGRMRLVIRVDNDPVSVTPDLRRVMSGVDPTLPFRTPMTMTEVISNTLIFERLENWVFGSFAGVALLLAAIGMYGLIGHEAQLSTRDIGVRMALGATRGDILLGIYRRVMWMVVTGLGVGLALTLAIQRYIQSVVAIHLKNDVGYIVALCLFLALLGLAAALFPALHAARIQPMEALKED
jgi:putative ABC transport system permease protein